MGDFEKPRFFSKNLGFFLYPKKFKVLDSVGIYMYGNHLYKEALQTKVIPYINWLIFEGINWLMSSLGPKSHR